MNAHPIAKLIKEDLVAPLIEDGGHLFLSIRARCEKLNYPYYDKLTFTIWGMCLNDTPYTRGETKLEGWNSLDQVLHSSQRPKKEFTAEQKRIIKKSKAKKLKLIIQNHVECVYCGERYNEDECEELKGGQYCCHDCFAQEGTTCEECDQSFLYDIEWKTSDDFVSNYYYKKLHAEHSCETNASYCNHCMTKIVKNHMNI